MAPLRRPAGRAPNGWQSEARRHRVSPTDAMPLAPWAKIAMAVQSLISLVILGLVKEPASASADEGGESAGRAATASGSPGATPTVAPTT